MGSPSTDSRNSVAADFPGVGLVYLFGIGCFCPRVSENGRKMLAKQFLGQLNWVSAGRCDSVLRLG